MPRAVLALNAGSSSIKFTLALAESATPQNIAHGEIESIATEPHFIARDATGALLTEQRWASQPSYETLLATLLTWIDSHLGPNTLAGVGHRVVHGGANFTAPVLVTEPILEALAQLTPLAPLHQPHNLSPIRAISEVRPTLPQVACFDTAFHHTQPEIATRFALPRAYHDAGIRRYGFHGLSYEFIAQRLQQTAPHLAAGRVIAAHLGNGASLCAMQSGKSIETTMGFTALDGLIMGTRCGNIDPGVVLYMQQQQNLTAAQIQHILYNESGLLGVSGISSDMRALLASPSPNAAAAIALFTRRIARETAALTAALGGLDALIFTAGIGEHAPTIRETVCAQLAFLGAELDAAANLANAQRISTPQSRIAILVIPTDEEAMLHHHTLATLTPGATP